MAKLGLEKTVVDQSVLDRTIGRFKEQGIVLPKLSQLADPTTIPEEVTAALAEVDPDEPHPLNLFRVHWYEDTSRKARCDVPEHVVLPKSITGVDAPIIVAFGNRFPMIRAHKVLAAYGCLAPRIVTGQFDPTVHRAVWPSTGNYCRGGVAISRIMGCHGVAVLPEGMSEERFNWLASWAADPSDIIRTPGTESNVKEIYDKCAELEADETNFIFNQFCEFGNHLVHWLCSGRALGAVYEHLRASTPGLSLFGFTSATGSAGTIAAGDYLKETYGTKIAAVEALECPTMLYNGYGEHNIQGIGDKHIPYIHNVMNTDVAVAVSVRSTDALGVAFASEPGQAYLRDRRGVPAAVVEALKDVGLSGIGNVLAAVKMAKHFGLGPDQAIITVATDGAEMYGSERSKTTASDFAGTVDSVAVAEAFGQHMLGTATDHLEELDHRGRDRIFNLGYYTWVEQQGVTVQDFDARRKQAFWTDLRELVGTWDALIDEFNAKAK